MSVLKFYAMMNYIKRKILKEHLICCFNSEEDMENDMCNKWDLIEEAMEEYAHYAVTHIK